MTSKQPTGISNQILIAGGVSFGLVNAFVLGNAWLTLPSWNLYMLAIPVAQCALVAAWAGTSKANLGLRFGMPIVTMLVSWKMVLHLLAYSFESTSATLWMLALSWVVSLVVAGTRAQRIGAESQNATEFLTSFVRVDLRTMMMLTVAAGLTFAFLQYGRVHWRWSVNDLKSPGILMFNLLGVLTGVQSLTCLGVQHATRFRQRLFRVALHLMVLVTCSFSFSYFVAPDTLATSVREMLTLWFTSNLIIISVMVFGRWLSTKSNPESSH